MEIDSQRNRHEDQMSDVRSFGSKYQRYSPSRKMSIGIAAASSANMSNITGSRYNPKGQKGSPWISPKPLVRSRTVSESLNTSKKVTNVAAVGGTCSNLGAVNEPTTGMSLQSGYSKQRNVDTVVPGKESDKDVINPERGKGLTLAAVEETNVPNEGVNQPKLRENRSKETLKMKLWEVLRTAPPIDEELDGSGSVEVDANVNKEDASFKPRVNSDTIETGSENPEVAVSRPVTRSLSRKRGSAVARPKRLRKKLFPANEEKNVFSFEEKCNGAQKAATGRHLQCNTNSTGKKSLNIRTTKISDPPPQMTNIQQASSGSKRPSNAEEISLRSGIGVAHGNKGQGRMKQAVHREYSHSSPEANDSGQRKEGNDLISPKKGGKKEHLDCGSEPRIADLINDIFGPVNNMKTGAQLPLPSAQAKETEEQNYTRMLARRIIFVKDAFRFKSTLEKQIHLGSHCRTESSNDPAESDDTVQSMKEKHDAELSTSGRQKINKTEEELSVSNGSGEDMDFNTGRANCSYINPIMHSPNVAGEYKDTTPGTDQFEKQMPCDRKQVEVPPRFNHSEPSSPFCFPNEHPTIEGSGDDSDAYSDVDRAEKHISSPARHEAYDAVNFNDLSPTFGSPNATRLTDASQEYQGDEVERAVALFGCALEKFKNKLVSSTKKRSSEVLESTAEEIHSKFQSAKSQIEKDVTKLTNASRSKRQTLEKSFKEQQEELQLIHERYKDEIRRHIQHYTKTVESLEAHGKDLKEVIERRKVSHQKLLVQVEEAVENHLSDAQRKLMSIHKEGRSKMQHLKTTIAGCLEDGIFT
ncbi:hypothetical protein V2J09_005910 [Rumex salicifolius]